MEAIDFMNQSIYLKQPGMVDDITSHPKFVLPILVMMEK